MSSPNEVSWQSVYYPLLSVALNSIFQPYEHTGRICGFDDSLGHYLRSSPIVCVVDAAFILIRFAFYLRRRGPGYSLARAAKEIRVARGLVDERPRPEQVIHEEPGHVKLTYLKYFVTMVAGLAQFLKLMAYSGGSGAIPWAKVWGCFYLGSWVVVEVTFFLARLEDDTNLNHAEIKGLESWIAPYETKLGWLAILVQLGILATVDMKAIPPDPRILDRWLFRGVRFAIHFVVLVVHLPFLMINRKIDAGKLVPSHYIGIFTVFTLVPYIILIPTQESRFSALYFMVSIVISYFSWTLYYFSWTRKLIFEPKGKIENGHRGEVGNRNGVPRINIPQNRVGFEETGWRNVLAFDFSLRILFFSTFWYVKHYDQTGTTKPQWTNILG